MRIQRDADNHWYNCVRSETGLLLVGKKASGERTRHKKSNQQKSRMREWKRLKNNLEVSENQQIRYHL